MNLKVNYKRAIFAICFIFYGCKNESSKHEDQTFKTVKKWHLASLDATLRDHSKPDPNSNFLSGVHTGPLKSSRALAIVHLAIYDAVAVSTAKYASYSGLSAKNGDVDIAIANAAYLSLVKLYPTQKSYFDELYSVVLKTFSNNAVSKEDFENGMLTGEECSKAIFVTRVGDKSDLNINYVPKNELGHYNYDPMNSGQNALGPTWGEVTPFSIENLDALVLPPPPSLDSIEYANNFDELLKLGGDGITTPTNRTSEQTEIGIFWAYDGTPGLGAPPRLFNQIALKIAEINNLNDGVELAKYLALINVGMADAGIACWKNKYLYDYWRPVTAIRAGEFDNNEQTIGNASFIPLGAPASNTLNNNFTPPFPGYPSGHSVFGGVVFEIMRNYFGTDEIPFDFVSDEMNGITKDNQGNIRKLSPRSFASLTAAERENEESRIFLGIHWRFDVEQGGILGHQIAKEVIKNTLEKNQDKINLINLKAQPNL